jgi:hypothetical protein
MNTTRLLPVALLMAGLVAPAAKAQQHGVRDPRWLPWLGCWATVQADTLASLTALCVIPAAGTSAVDIVVITDLRVVARSHIEASGEQRPSALGGCTGWERAEWSPEGRRVFLRAEHDCAGEPHRVTTAIMAMTSAGQWLAVQGASAEGRPSVRVQHYNAAAPDLAIPEEVVTALADSSADRHAARFAVAPPVGVAEVVAASHQVEPFVVESWLSIARGPSGSAGASSRSSPTAVCRRVPSMCWSPSRIRWCSP